MKKSYRKVILKGKQFTGLSHRYGILLSVEKAGIFLIIHFNHKRRWVGFGYPSDYYGTNKS